MILSFWEGRHHLQLAGAYYLNDPMFLRGQTPFTADWSILSSWSYVFESADTIYSWLKHTTLMIPSFQTDRSVQTPNSVGLHDVHVPKRSSLIRVYTVCHSVCIYWTYYSMIKIHIVHFRIITAYFVVISTLIYSLWYSQMVIQSTYPLYNVGVGPQWFMTLKWICRCNDFMLFRPQE